MTVARVVAVKGDLTRQDVDAVVNAANTALVHGGGVAAALVRAAGEELQSESDRWVAEHGPVPEGSAAVTSAGRLQARWVIHVVGPVYDPASANNSRFLVRAVDAALDAARDLGARSVALPAISAGIFGYPLEGATAVIAAAAKLWAQRNPGSVSEIRLVGFDDAAFAAFSDALRA